ncbi:MAG: methyltransferase domain-containing protein [Deltaproteobacteria bacterium]|nr:methyltransferase domain-containing protein [Deltaproteobacteria bacterium]
MTTDLTEAEIGLIREKIKEKYTGVAATGAGGCFRYPTGIDGLRKLGYPEDILRQFPPAVLELFCGVGNPFSLGPLYPGESVLDLGCGAGVDTFIAATMVGPRGRVVGLDVTPEMIAKARANLALTGLKNVAFDVGEAESLPFPNDSFDAVISNGVINLTVDKEKVLQEVHRVLKPGGRLMVADMVLMSALPEERAGRVENWFQ